MSWSATISGHTESKDEEAAVLELLAECARETKATGASASTQHHGQVGLLGAVEPSNDEPAENEEAAGEAEAEPF